MAAKDKRFVYEYLKNGSVRSVKFATMDQAMRRAVDGCPLGRMRFNRAAPWAIEEMGGEGFLGTEELFHETKRMLDAEKALRAADTGGGRNGT